MNGKGEPFYVWIWNTGECRRRRWEVAERRRLKFKSLSLKVVFEEFDDLAISDIVSKRVECRNGCVCRAVCGFIDNSLGINIGACDIDSLENLDWSSNGQNIKTL